MPQPIDREGVARAYPVSWGLTEPPSGAIGWACRFRIVEWWNGEAWEDWTQFECEVEGTFWLTKKDGTVNENAARSLSDSLGWNDAEFETLRRFDWSGKGVQIAIKEEEYNKVRRFRAAFINPWDSTPGGGASDMSDEKIKQAQARFGSQLRAIIGQKPAPPGSPSAPKPVVPKPKIPPTGSAAAKQKAATAPTPAANTEAA